jgi:hypothetical protein
MTLSVSSGGFLTRYFRQISWSLSCMSVLLLAAPRLVRANSTPLDGAPTLTGSSGTYAGDGPAVSFTGVSTNFSNGSFSLGWDFTTNVAIDVTALGYYNASLTGGDDTFQDGTCSCGDVGIYDASMDLLASTTVTSADPVIGFFNYAPITTLVLAAGETYYIMGETGTSDYTYAPTGFAVSPDISFVHDGYASSDTLAFPTGSSLLNATDAGWFSANFEETPASAVPEPSSLLLLVAGMLGLGGIARRKFSSKG